jgi:hypothetical protein
MPAWRPSAFHGRLDFDPGVDSVEKGLDHGWDL